METHNYIDAIGHRDVDTHLDTHSYTRAMGP